MKEKRSDILESLIDSLEQGLAKNITLPPDVISSKVYPLTQMIHQIK